MIFLRLTNFKKGQYFEIWPEKDNLAPLVAGLERSSSLSLLTLELS